jgi:hypothetical protein
MNLVHLSNVRYVWLSYELWLYLGDTRRSWANLHAFHTLITRNSIALFVQVLSYEVSVRWIWKRSMGLTMQVLIRVNPLRFALVMTFLSELIFLTCQIHIVIQTRLSFTLSLSIAVGTRSSSLEKWELQICKCHKTMLVYSPTPALSHAINFENQTKISNWKYVG